MPQPVNAQLVLLKLDKHIVKNVIGNVSHAKDPLLIVKNVLEIESQLIVPAHQEHLNQKIKEPVAQTALGNAIHVWMMIIIVLFAEEIEFALLIQIMESLALAPVQMDSLKPIRKLVKNAIQIVKLAKSLMISSHV